MPYREIEIDIEGEGANLATYDRNRRLGFPVGIESSASCPDFVDKWGQVLPFPRATH